MPSARLRLSRCSSTMRSSIEPAVTKRNTVTGRSWPVRWAWPMAWSSAGGRPGVDDQHVVGGGQVQAETAGLQADEEQVALAALEGHHVLAALGRGRAAVQVLVADAGPNQPFGQQLEKVGELAAHQCLVAPGDELQGELFEFLHLGAYDARIVADNHLLSSGMSSDSARRQQTHPSDPEVRFAVLISPPRSRRSEPHTSTRWIPRSPHQTHASTGGTKGNGVPATSLDDVK